jgi:hypothetical protein
MTTRRLPVLLQLASALWFGWGCVTSSSAQEGLQVTDARGTLLFSYGASHALVIWAGDYKNPFWKKLNNLQHEAADFAAALNRQGFQVDVVANPGSLRLKQSIEDFVKRFGYNPENRLVIYFAGHGWTRNNDLGYLVPVDAPAAARADSDLEFAKSALSMEQIMSWAKQMEAKHVLFIFDSCFSGAIFKVRSASPLPTYLQRKMNMPVRQFLTAGDVNEVVPATSLFTPLLIRALDGAADFNHDGYVTGSELGEYLPQQMANYSSAQNPQYGKIRDPRLDEGDIVFRVVRTAAGGVPALPQGSAPSASPPPQATAPSGRGRIDVLPMPRQPEPPLPEPPRSVPPGKPSLISAESIRDRGDAARLATDQLPPGAKVTDTRCTEISVAGNARYRCTVWFTTSSP